MFLRFIGCSIAISTYSMISHSGKRSWEAEQVIYLISKKIPGFPISCKNLGRVGRVFYNFFLTFRHDSHTLCQLRQYRYHNICCYTSCKLLQALCKPQIKRLGSAISADKKSSGSRNRKPVTWFQKHYKLIASRREKINDEGTFSLQN